MAVGAVRHLQQEHSDPAQSQLIGGLSRVVDMPQQRFTARH